MGRRDQYGKRIKWTKAEKRMAREMRSVGLCSSLPNLAVRAHAQRNQENIASTSSHQYFDHSFPEQMRQVSLRAERPRIRSIIVVPEENPADMSDLSVNQGNEERLHELIGDAMMIEDDDHAEGKADDADAESDGNGGDDEMEVEELGEKDEDAEKGEVIDAYTPQFFPVNDGPWIDPTQFDLDNLDVDVILDICRALPRTQQVHFLLASSAVSRHPEVRILLFQLRRTQKAMERVLGGWMYWQRWERPREVAPTMPNREDRLEQALRDYYRFNVHARTNKMTINQIAHGWHVFGTELREEIEFQEQQTDSDYDDVMQ